MKKETVNLFFACDERYLPLFGVALASLKAKRDVKRNYTVYVLHTDVSDSVAENVCAYYSEKGFSLRFRNVSREVESFTERLHTRDYYSKATYYRLLIPDLYPNMKKALYLDSDILLREDVARLFDTDITGMLAGAIPDGFVNQVPVLRRYVENRVGVPADMPYFNAGVLLMNLVEMRKIGFGALFLRLLSAVTFRVAQDQDYLNVLCRGKTKFLSEEWNFMPFRDTVDEPMLVHFNLDCKPWQKDGIRYADEFWAYAEATPYGEELRARRAAYSEEDVRRAAEQTSALIDTAVRESDETVENRRIALRVARVLFPDTEKREAVGSQLRIPTPTTYRVLAGRAL